MKFLQRRPAGYHLLLFSCYLLILLLLCATPIHRRVVLLPTHLSHGNSAVIENVVSENSRFSQVSQERDSCEGRRVYVYPLPSQFNTGLLKKCDKELVSWLNFCAHIDNHGLGKAIEDTPGWYGTDAYMLEVIYHSRLQSYSCLTNETSQADAFFVPYYSGIDALRYLYSNERDTHGRALVEWVEKNYGDVWGRWDGRDHFMVMGRTAWDFVVPSMGSWGTGILSIPEVARMNTLYIERNPWDENQIAVPYPTSFHPSTAGQLEEWIQTVRNSPRVHLFAFAGGIRPTMYGNIRHILLDQCRNTTRCVHVDCGQLRCGHDPRPSVKHFLKSQFCLQPRGDTPTRRSTFDALISGCIPVFFHPDSAYSQYIWHIPKNPASFSVYIPEEKVQENGGVNITQILSSYSNQDIKNMQKNILEMIPRIIYRMPGHVQNEEEDAFDVSLRKVLERITDLKLKSRA